MWFILRSLSIHKKHKIASCFFLVIYVCATYDLYCCNFYLGITNRILPLCFSSDLLTFALVRTWSLFRFIEWVEMSVIFTLGMCAYNSCLIVAAIDVTCYYLWGFASYPYYIFCSRVTLSHMVYYICSVRMWLFFKNTCSCCFKIIFMAYK